MRPWAYGKTIIFGVSKRRGKVYAEIVPDFSRAILQATIRVRLTAGTVIYSDRCRDYDGLVDIGFNKYFRVRHGDNEFARGEWHINGNCIESFLELHFNHHHVNLYHAIF